MEAVYLYFGILNLLVGAKMIYVSFTEDIDKGIWWLLLPAISCLPLTVSYYLFEGIVF